MNENLGLNTNSYISLSLMVLIVSAALWINNSINAVQGRQIKQEDSQNNQNVIMSSKIDDMRSIINGLVTRHELEAKISELRLDQSKLELEILKAQSTRTEASQNRR